MNKLRRNRLTAAVQLTLLIALPGVALAQDEAKDGGPQALDTINITGTRIKRVDSETASPVFKIDKQAIEATGALTIGDFIQDVPSMAGAATNPSVNNGGGDGATTISLRGLKEVRTLILVNGRRIVTRDVNSIPMSMVERVEILKDGASAIYGSDAVGGVVNFILRKQMEGLSTTLNYGISGEKDGERAGLSATWGTSTDRGNLIVSANYNNQQEVKAADRAFSHDALTLGSTSSSGVQTGGSSRSLTGRYSVPTSVTGLTCTNLTRIASRPGNAIGDFRCFTGADLFNYQAVGNLELTPQERLGVFVSGNYDIVDGVTGYLDAFTNRTRSAGQIAPLPFDGRPGQDNIVISANNIYNPFGRDITDSRLRLAALGNRRYEFSTKVNQFTAGLRGNFGDTTWSWDTNVSNGSIDQESAAKGYVSTKLLAPALGPSMLIGGKPACVSVAGNAATVIAGCVPVNMFGSQDPGSADGQAFRTAVSPYIVNPVNTTKQRYTGLQLNFAGDLFDLQAGAVKGAFGFEYRKESLTFAPDPLAVIETVNFTCGIASELCVASTKGSNTVKELYGELFFPILADAPWAKSFNITVGTRFSKYSTFGSTTNSKIGFEWRPNDQLLLRGTYAQVFRAPTINDLFSGASAASDGFTDPCNGFNLALANTNPACVGLRDNTGGAGFRQSDTQLSAIKGGNADLTPEKGTVVTWGLVYEPSWLSGFSTTMDLWRVHLDDTISNYGTQNILNACFLSTIANPSPLCSLFSRGSDGEILRLFDKNANVGPTDTSGVDIGFRYGLDTDWGKFKATWDSTYIIKYDQDIIFGGKKLSDLRNAGGFLSPANGGLGNYSRWRSLASLNWNLGNWDATWTVRFVQGFHVGSLRPIDTCANLFFAGRNPNPACRFEVGSTTYHNFQVGYGYKPWGMKARVGIDNAFDKQPPILYQNNTLNGNTDERTFDTVGRYFWTSITFDFK
jgi:iron complex outermembrane recepter protein